MTEIWFYHLLTRSLEQVLPGLLEKSRERGWSVVVQGRDAMRLDQLDQYLWTYETASFLPHASASDSAKDGVKDAQEQPIWLTLDTDTPNGAKIRFMIDGADVISFVSAGHADHYDRIVVIFNGNNEDELNLARQQWKDLRDKDLALSYFQQNEDGRWDKKA
jgi:DNA polymerase III subunit chi